MANWFVSFWKKLGGLLKAGLKFAVERGLTDEIVKIALALVKIAGNKFVDNTERREFVVAALVKKGIPESIARIAVEIAVQLWKKSSIGKQTAVNNDACPRGLCDV